MNFHWNNDFETLLQKIKTSTTESVFLTPPKTNHPFFNTVDLFLISIGCVPFQTTDKGKLDNVSHNSRSFFTNEQKLCNTNRELLGFVCSLTIYEHDFVSSDHFSKILKDNKATLSTFTRKGNF